MGKLLTIVVDDCTHCPYHILQSPSIGCRKFKLQYTKEGANQRELDKGLFKQCMLVENVSTEPEWKIGELS